MLISSETEQRLNGSTGRMALLIPGHTLTESRSPFLGRGTPRHLPPPPQHLDADTGLAGEGVHTVSHRPGHFCLLGAGMTWG